MLGWYLRNGCSRDFLRYYHSLSLPVELYSSQLLLVLRGQIIVVCFGAEMKRTLY